MEFLGDVVRWFADGANWSGEGGIPTRLWEHVQISLLSVGIAAILAFPAGMLIGHTKRGEFLAVSIGNVGRALPSFGILALVFPFTLRYFPGSIGFPPTLIALTLLAIPPILTNTYVGIQGVDQDTVESARGMGMSERQVLFRLEMPLAARLIVAGLRTAAVQVVATATLGAVFGWGGLGRFIRHGFSTRDNVETFAGAVLVAALAIITELVFELIERTATPRTRSTGRARSSVAATQPATAA